MQLKLLIGLAILLVISADGKKTGRSRSSGAGRGSSRKTNSNPQPAPTSFSYSQPSSAQKPSLSGWQAKPAPKPSQSHSYPSSGTGLSGNKNSHTNQESIQRSSASNNHASQQRPASNQGSHSYPASTGLSGSPGNGYPQQSANKYPQQNTGLGNPGGQSGYPQSPGAGYPHQQGSGLSGNQPGNSYPQQQGSGLSGSGQPGHSYPQQHGGSYPQSGNPQMGGGYPQAPPPYSGYRPGGQNNYGNNYHNQGPPPPYSNVGPGHGGFGGPGSYNPGYGSQMPGYFGNYGKGGGVSRKGSVLTGVGIAGAGIGTVLTGLALWNMARSTGRDHHTVIYDNRGQPVAVAPGNDTNSEADSILANLSNCSLTISNDEKTEVLAIPCSIATSFTPDAEVKSDHVKENPNDNTKCIVTILTKTGTEYTTTIPCSVLLNSAAENNVTEPPLVDKEPSIMNGTAIEADHLKDGGGVVESSTLLEPTALKLSGDSNLNCTLSPEEMKDPINPCYSVNHDLTVIPLPTTNVPKTNVAN